MLVLVIDTASAATTVAVASVDGAQLDLRANRVNVDPRAHGEVLAPAIEDCLREADARPADLGAVVAGLGPGPYTGLRVGLVTAAVLSDALQIPSYGVCSLDGIGGALPGEPSLLVAGDARRREVYWAAYANGARTGEPQVSKPADLDLTGYTAAAGSGARLYANVLGLRLVGVDHPDPIALIGAALDRIAAAAPSERLTPLYLRRPDAVEPGARKSVL